MLAFSFVRSLRTSPLRRRWGSLHGCNAGLGGGEMGDDGTESLGGHDDGSL